MWSDVPTSRLMPACVIHQPFPVCGYRSAFRASCVWAPSTFSAPPCSSRDPTWWPSGWAEPWRASSSNTSCLISVSPWWRLTCRLRWPNNFNCVPSSVALSTQVSSAQKRLERKVRKNFNHQCFVVFFCRKICLKCQRIWKYVPPSRIQNDLKEVSWQQQSPFTFKDFCTISQFQVDFFPLFLTWQ